MGLKESEQVQSVKPVESGQEGAALWVIKKVSVGVEVVSGSEELCGASRTWLK
jgi:hypothetical protein